MTKEELLDLMYSKKKIKNLKEKEFYMFTIADQMTNNLAGMNILESWLKSERSKTISKQEIINANVPVSEIEEVFENENYLKFTELTYYHQTPVKTVYIHKEYLKNANISIAAGIDNDYLKEEWYIVNFQDPYPIKTGYNYKYPKESIIMTLEDTQRIIDIVGKKKVSLSTQSFVQKEYCYGRIAAIEDERKTINARIKKEKDTIKQLENKEKKLRKLLGEDIYDRDALKYELIKGE